jgi:hypothetical protein
MQERQFKDSRRQQRKEVKEELYCIYCKKKLPFHWRLQTNAKEVVMITKGNRNFSKRKHHLFSRFADGTFVPFGVIYDDLWNKIKLSGLDFEGKQQFHIRGDLPTSDTPSEIMTGRTSSAGSVAVLRQSGVYLLKPGYPGGSQNVILDSTFKRS